MRSAPEHSPLAKWAPLIVVAAGFCWGCVGLFIRPLQDLGFSSFQLSWVRSLLTALFFLAFVLVRNRNLLRVSPRDAWCFLGTGLVSVAFFSVCYYTTISLTSLSVAAVLMYTAPAFVLVFSHLLFGDAITPVKVAAVVLIIVGCALVSGFATGVPQVPLLGLLTGLGAGVGYASYSIFSRYALNKGYESLTITVWTFVIAAIAMAFMCDPAATVAHIAATPGSIPLLVGLALVNAVTPYALFTLGLKYMENSRAAVFVSVEPVVAALVGMLAFGEAFTWFIAMGIALVLLAIALLGRT